MARRRKTQSEKPNKVLVAAAELCKVFHLLENPGHLCVLEGVPEITPENQVILEVEELWLESLQELSTEEGANLQQELEVDDDDDDHDDVPQHLLQDGEEDAPVVLAGVQDGEEDDLLPGFTNRPVMDIRDVIYKSAADKLRSAKFHLNIFLKLYSDTDCQNGLNHICVDDLTSTTSAIMPVLGGNAIKAKFHTTQPPAMPVP
jgi:hypothetical protein